MTCGTSSAQTRDDARVNEEREEAQVMIACGFDVHRAQITFDLVDHETGEVRRGRIVPATREQLRVWLAGLETARLVIGGPCRLMRPLWRLPADSCTVTSRPASRTTLRAEEKRRASPIAA